MICEPEIIHTKVVGVTFEGRQYALQALERLGTNEKDQVKLSLRREPENEYDQNAIAVDVTYFDHTYLTEMTRPLGYIRKELSQIFCAELEGSCEFEIIDFESTGGYNKTRGINISILRKEKGMAKVTALDLLNKKAGSGYDKNLVLKLAEGTTLSLRFLKPISEAYIDAMHSIAMPNGKRERFQCLKFVGEGQECPADVLGDAWTKLVLPVIDRSDGKVKLFRESPAVYRKLQFFEGDPTTDAEKTMKIGDLTRADIQIFQTGKGKDRSVTAFPIPNTVRDLTADEKKLESPDPASMSRILTKDEVQRIVDEAAGQKNDQAQASMNVSTTGSGPFAR